MLELTLLGGLKIAVDGCDLAPAMPRKAALLLAYLAVTGRAHTRQSLANLLWGESPESSARLSLRTALWSLGGRLACCLEAGRQQVALRPGSFRADAVEFPRLATRAASEDPAAARAALQQAVNLYHGDLLAGWAAGRAAAFDDWLIVERQRLQDVALETLYRLAALLAGEGAYGEGIATARRLLALEPWHEEGQRLLIQLLALSGRRAEAIMQYRAMRRLLVLELGTEPAMETQELYHELLRAGRRERR